ncbi:unnamed protein product [Staurois parvus]|uniref:Uncharacterized protein n=1 Tax=Staurois parvus TaxID=386267 RepID=A0ABN9D2B3_9NEOB|nr:unnamed protein product [Staurois parvus]
MLEFNFNLCPYLGDYKRDVRENLQTFHFTGVTGNKREIPPKGTQVTIATIAGTSIIR